MILVTSSVTQNLEFYIFWKVDADNTQRHVVSYVMDCFDSMSMKRSVSLLNWFPPIL